MYYICYRLLKEPEREAGLNRQRERKQWEQRMLNRFNKLILHKHILYSGINACKQQANIKAALFFFSFELIKTANTRVTRTAGTNAA